MKTCLVFGALLVLGAGIAASPVHAQEVINACVKTENGQTRIVSSPDKCLASERAVQWNVAGPQGPKGDPGPAAGGAPRFVDSNGESLGAYTLVGFSNLMSGVMFPLGDEVGFVQLWPLANPPYADLAYSTGTGFRFTDSTCSGQPLFVVLRPNQVAPFVTVLTPLFVDNTTTPRRVMRLTAQNPQPPDPTAPPNWVRTYTVNAATRSFEPAAGSQCGLSGPLMPGALVGAPTLADVPYLSKFVPPFKLVAQ